MRLAPWTSRATGYLWVAAIAVAFTTPALGQRQQRRADDAIRIPFERYKLPNGLNVILVEDHSTPTVAVDIWYHVGSKNELPGRTGFAHLFEHVMFTGSGHAPYGLHDRLTGGVGGTNNAGITNDFTVYYDIIPSNYLESTLWLESDRMGFLLDKLDSTKFVAQRDIVQNERRQRVENAPYGRASEIVYAAMYPATNPYSWPTGGRLVDLQTASLEDVKRFFRTYYAPSNASIAIVGDFRTPQVKQWIAKYFSGLPRGRAIVRPDVKPAALRTERRLVYEDRVQLPRLYIRWPSVGIKDEDNYALQVLASVLVGTRTARLNKALVYDRQSAATVSGAQSSSFGCCEHAGDFGITIVPRPGHSLTELELAADSVIERFKREGPTPEELQRANAGLEFDFVSELESNIGKADRLNGTYTFFADPGYYQTQIAKLKAVTASDVKRVANTYLGPGRVVLSIVPQGSTALAAKAEESAKVTVSTDGGHYIMESK